MKKQLFYSPNSIQVTDTNTTMCLKRGKYVQATSEEYVRQAVLKFLVEDLKIALEDIEVEYALSKVDNSSKRRADILVYHKSIALLVIECKAPEIILTEDIYNDQALDYAKSTDHPELIWVTNGYDNQYFAFHQDTENYRQLEELPDLKNPKEMKLVYYSKEHEPWVAPSYQQIWDNGFTEQFANSNIFKYPTWWYYPAFANQAARAANIRLGEFLFFSKEIPKDTALGPFTVIEDRGVVFKSVPVPGHRYYTNFRTLSVVNQAGETFIWDTGFIFLNEQKETHLASRISEKGIGSFNIQAALNLHYVWDDKNECFSFTHNPNRLTMGKNNLGKKANEYIQTIQPDLLKNNQLFHSTPIDARLGVDLNYQQYLNFFGNWGSYVEAIRRMKEENKSLKVPKAERVKKPNVLADAKKLVNRGLFEVGINYIIDNLEFIDKSRQSKALDFAYSTALDYYNFEIARTLLHYVRRGSEQELRFKSELAYFEGNYEDCLQIASKLKDKESFAYYWGSKYLIEGPKNQNNHNELFELIRNAYELRPGDYEFQNYYSYELIKLGKIQEGISVFDKIPIRHVYSQIEVLNSIEILLNFGPVQKLYEFINQNFDDSTDELNDFFLGFYQILVTLNIRKFDHSKAKTYCEIILKQFPDNLFAIDSLEIIKWREGNISGAFEYFLNNHDNIPSYNLYALVLSRTLGNKKEEKIVFSRLEKLLANKQSTYDIHFHAANIISPFIYGDKKSLTLALQRAKKELYRTDGLADFLNFLVELLKLDKKDFSSSVVF